MSSTERVRNPTTAFSSATGSGYVASSRRNTAPVSPYSHSRRRATIDVISGAVRCIAKHRARRIGREAIEQTAAELRLGGPVHVGQARDHHHH
jgi:hypothetical protein